MTKLLREYGLASFDEYATYLIDVEGSGPCEVDEYHEVDDWGCLDCLRRTPLIR